MRKYLIISVLLLIYSCYQEEQLPIKAGTPSKFNLIDTTYSKRSEKWFLEDSVLVNLDFPIPAMDNWEEVIRLGGSAGWGQFDYLCSIYRSEPPRIQLIGNRQEIEQGEKIVFNDTPIYKERIISYEAYDSILNVLIKSNIPQMRMYLYPNWGCMDCSNFYIAIKNKDYKKVVTWQGTHLEVARDSGHLQLPMDIYRKIMRYAGYPMADGVIGIQDKVRDSIIYYFGFVDFGITTYDPQITFDQALTSPSVSPPHLGTHGEFIIPTTDTADLVNRIRIFSIQGPGDTIFAKSIIVMKER